MLLEGVAPHALCMFFLFNLAVLVPKRLKAHMDAYGLAGHGWSVGQLAGWLAVGYSNVCL